MHTIQDESGGKKIQLLFWCLSLQRKTHCKLESLFLPRVCVQTVDVFCCYFFSLSRWKRRRGVKRTKTTGSKGRRKWTKDTNNCNEWRRKVLLRFLFLSLFTIFFFSFLSLTWLSSSTRVESSTGICRVLFSSSFSSVWSETLTYSSCSAESVIASQWTSSRRTRRNEKEVEAGNNAGRKEGRVRATVLLFFFLSFLLPSPLLYFRTKF